MSQWSWGFLTVRGSVNLVDLPFHPRFVGVENAWKYFMLRYDLILPGRRWIYEP